MALPRRGEIWYVSTPGQPDDPHQPRPALVISENVRNRLSDDLIVAPIFSTGRAGPTHVPLPAGMGAIPHDGVLFCEELTTLHERFFSDGPLGPPVADEILWRVLWALRRALGEVVPRP